MSTTRTFPEWNELFSQREAELEERRASLEQSGAWDEFAQSRYAELKEDVKRARFNVARNRKLLENARLHGDSWANQPGMSSDQFGDAYNENVPRGFGEPYGTVFGPVDAYRHLVGSSAELAGRTMRGAAIAHAGAPSIGGADVTFREAEQSRLHRTGQWLEERGRKVGPALPEHAGGSFLRSAAELPAQIAVGAATTIAAAPVLGPGAIVAGAAVGGAVGALNEGMGVFERDREMLFRRAAIMSMGRNPDEFMAQWEQGELTADDVRAFQKALVDVQQNDEVHEAVSRAAFNPAARTAGVAGLLSAQPVGKGIATALRGLAAKSTAIKAGVEAVERVYGKVGGPVVEKALAGKLGAEGARAVVDTLEQGLGEAFEEWGVEFYSGLDAKFLSKHFPETTMAEIAKSAAKTGLAGFVIGTWASTPLQAIGKWRGPLADAPQHVRDLVAEAEREGRKLEPHETAHIPESTARMEWADWKFVEAELRREHGEPEGGGPQFIEPSPEDKVRITREVEDRIRAVVQAGDVDAWAVEVTRALEAKRDATNPTDYIRARMYVRGLLAVAKDVAGAGTGGEDEGEAGRAADPLRDAAERARGEAASEEQAGTEKKVGDAAIEARLDEYQAPESLEADIELWQQQAENRRERGDTNAAGHLDRLARAGLQRLEAMRQAALNQAGADEQAVADEAAAGVEAAASEVLRAALGGQPELAEQALSQLPPDQAAAVLQQPLPQTEEAQAMGLQTVGDALLLAQQEAQEQAREDGEQADEADVKQLERTARRANALSKIEKAQHESRKREAEAREAVRGGDQRGVRGGRVEEGPGTQGVPGVVQEGRASEGQQAREGVAPPQRRRTKKAVDERQGELPLFKLQDPVRAGPRGQLTEEEREAREAPPESPRVASLLAQLERAETSFAGLGNKARLERDEDARTHVVIDLDGLKRLNDTLGHDAGNALLEAFATAIQEGLPDGARVFHPHGDEFIVRGEDPEAIRQHVEGVRDLLEGRTLEVTDAAGVVHRNTIRFSYGLAVDQPDYKAQRDVAEAGLRADKKARADAGLRFERGADRRVVEERRGAADGRTPGGVHRGLAEEAAGGRREDREGRGQVGPTPREPPKPTKPRKPRQFTSWQTRFLRNFLKAEFPGHLSWDTLPESVQDFAEGRRGTIAAEDASELADVLEQRLPPEAAEEDVGGWWGEESWGRGSMRVTMEKIDALLETLRSSPAAPKFQLRPEDERIQRAIGRYVYIAGARGFRAWNGKMRQQLGADFAKQTSGQRRTLFDSVQAELKDTAPKLRDGKLSGGPRSPKTLLELAGIAERGGDVDLPSGVKGRFWYSDSAAAIIERFGKAAVEFLKYLSVTSAQRRPVDNTLFAVNAYAQVLLRPGKKIAGSPDEGIRRIGPAAVTKMANDVRETGEWSPTAQKTQRFFRNLAHDLGFTSDDVTVDMWMMRALGYDTDNPTEAQYRHAQLIIQTVADVLGWAPREAQAAIWVDLKMNSPDPRDRDVRNYRSTLEYHERLLSFEATPSRKVPFLQEIHDAPFGVKLAYADHVNRNVVPKIIEALGLEKMGIEVKLAPGGYQLDTNPGLSTKVPLPDWAADTFAAALGYVLSQESVLVSQFGPKSGKTDFVTLRFPAGTLTPSTAHAFFLHAAGVHKGLGGGYMTFGDDMIFLNVRGDDGPYSGLKPAEYQRLLLQARNTFPAAVVIDNLTHGRANAHFVGNDWEANPNGEGYESTLDRGRDGLVQHLRGIRDVLAREAQGIVRRAKEGQGGQAPRPRRRAAGQRVQDRGTPDGEPGPRLSETDQRRLRSVVESLLPGAEVSFPHEIRDPEGRAAYGRYWRGAVEIALDQDLITGESTAVHEAFHGFMRWLKTSDPRGHELVLRAYGSETLGHKVAEERAADDSAVHWRSMQTIQNAPVRRLLAKFKAFITKLGNFLRGKGYKSATAFMDDFVTGKLREEMMQESTGDVPRFRRQSSFTAPDETLVDRLLWKLQDRFRPLKKIQAAIEETRGAPIGESADPYVKEELLHSKAKNDLDNFQDDEVAPLIKEMVRRKVSIEQLGEYLLARHAAERNARIADINKDMPDGGSGMTESERRATMRKFRLAGLIDDESSIDGGRGALRDLAQRVDRMVERTRLLLERSGLVESGLVDEWRGMYNYYVPLHGFAADDSADGQASRTGRGLSIKGMPKRALGRTSEPANPFVNVLRDRMETIVRARKNEVGKALLKLAEQNPNDDVWRVYSEDNPEKTRRVKVWYEEPLTQKTSKKWKPGYRKRSMVVTAPAVFGNDHVGVRRSGKQFYVAIADPRLRKSLLSVGHSDMGKIVSAAHSMNRFLSMVNTSLSPEFVISNFARDVQTAILNLAAEQEMPGGKARGASIVKQVLKDIPSSIAAVHAGLRKKAHKDPATAQVWAEFLEDGARAAWFHVPTLEQEMSRLGGLVDMANGSFKGTAKQAWHATWTYVDDLNGSVENGVRFAAYRKAREAGIPRQQAASLAKNLTVNFNRRGDAGVLLNSMYLFFNASVQGTANFARGFLKSKWKRRAGGALVALGALQAMVNEALSDDDEDGVSFYSKIPNHERERNWIVMSRDGRSYYKIPMPYGYSVLANLGEALGSLAVRKVTKTGGRSVEDSAVFLAGGILGSFNPVGMSQSKSFIGTIMKTGMPTAVTPLAELYANENYYGAPISKKNFPRGVQLPDSSLAHRSTRPWAKATAQWINELTGGNLHEPGKADISPDTFEYLLDYFTGSAGRVVRQTGQLAAEGVSRAAGKPPTPIPTRNVPLLRRVKGEPAEYTNTNLYYERTEVLTRKVARSKSLSGDDKRRYDSDNADYLKVAVKMKAAEKRLDGLRSRRKTIESKPPSNDAEAMARAAKLDQIEQEIMGTYKQFNGDWNSTLGRFE